MTAVGTLDELTTRALAGYQTDVELSALRGEMSYGSDIHVQGQLYIGFARSSVAHGMIRLLDTSSLDNASGIVKVYTGRSVAGKALVDGMDLPGLTKTEQPLIAGEKVRFVGEVVAAIIGESPEAVQDAMDNLLVEYEPLRAYITVHDESGVEASAIHDHVPDNVLYDDSFSYGDVDGAFRKASVIVERRLKSGRVNAAPLEPRCCLAIPEEEHGELHVLSSTQAPSVLRAKVAAALDRGPDSVKITALHMGGAFGQKIPASPEEILTALAAVDLGRPVKWREDRYSNMVGATHAKEQYAEVMLAFDGEARILAADALFVGDAGAYSFNSSTGVIEPFLAARILPGPYVMPALRARVVAVLTNKTPTASYRGVGYTMGQTVRELALDKAARIMQIGKAEIRRRNLVREFPYANGIGQVFRDGYFMECLAAVENGSVPPSDRLAKPELADLVLGDLELARQMRLGSSVTCQVEPTGWGSRGMRETGWPGPADASEHAILSLMNDGSIEISIGTPILGQGLDRSLQNVVVESLGVPSGHVFVRPVQATSGLELGLLGTRASRTAVVTGAAVLRGCLELRALLVKTGAELLEAATDDIVLDDGRAYVKGTPSRYVSLADMAGSLTSKGSSRASADSGYSGTPADAVGLVSAEVAAVSDPDPVYGAAAYACTVAVDEETGKVIPRTLKVAEDCGKVLDPMAVQGQLVGAMAQAVGAALFEDIPYDSDGQPLATNLSDYLIPSATEMPEFSVIDWRSGSLSRPNEPVKGVGEAGMIGGVGAVIAAIEDAVGGLEIEEYPATPERLLNILRGSPASVRSGRWTLRDA